MLIARIGVLIVNTNSPLQLTPVAGPHFDVEIDQNVGSNRDGLWHVSQTLVQMVSIRLAHGQPFARMYRRPDLDQVDFRYG